MSNFTICNVCESPGRLESAAEIERVASNVRKFCDQKFTVWRCTNCRSLHSKEEVDLEHYYAYYPLAQQRSGYINRLAFLNRIRLLKRLGINHGSRLLDYGCGNGQFVALLRERGFRRVAGYDPFMPEYADSAVLSEQYDMVVSYGVIEHVPDPGDYLKQLRSTLAVGGMAVVATPNADALDLAQPDPLMLHQPYHTHILSEQAIVPLAAKYGFKLKHFSRRYWMDRLHPAVNCRFITDYVRHSGGAVDALFEPVRFRMVLSSPRLLWWLVAGYFAPLPGYMICGFEAE